MVRMLRGLRPGLRRVRVLALLGVAGLLGSCSAAVRSGEPMPDVSDLTLPETVAAADDPFTTLSIDWPFPLAWALTNPPRLPVRGLDDPDRIEIGHVIRVLTAERGHDAVFDELYARFSKLADEIEAKEGDPSRGSIGRVPEFAGWKDDPYPFLPVLRAMSWSEFAHGRIDEGMRCRLLSVRLQLRNLPAHRTPHGTLEDQTWIALADLEEVIREGRLAVVTDPELLAELRVLTLPREMLDRPFSRTFESLRGRILAGELPPGFDRESLPRGRDRSDPHRTVRRVAELARVFRARYGEGPPSKPPPSDATTPAGLDPLSDAWVQHARRRFTTVHWNRHFILVQCTLIRIATAIVETERRTGVSIESLDAIDPELAAPLEELRWGGIGMDVEGERRLWYRNGNGGMVWFLDLPRTIE